MGLEKAARLPEYSVTSVHPPLVIERLQTRIPGFSYIEGFAASSRLPVAEGAVHNVHLTCNESGTECGEGSTVGAGEDSRSNPGQKGRSYFAPHVQASPASLRSPTPAGLLTASSQIPRTCLLNSQSTRVSPSRRYARFLRIMSRCPSSTCLLIDWHRHRTRPQRVFVQARKAATGPETVHRSTFPVQAITPPALFPFG